MATWNGVITNAGNDILTEWLNEKVLNFDGAATGQGTVAEIALMAQTDLVSKRQDAGILKSERVSTGIRLKIRITAPEDAYTMNQYGVWASINGGKSVMIALFQLEEGVQIPSKTESPDFAYTFYALIMCSNTGTWTVTVNTETLATIEEVNSIVSSAVALKQDTLIGVKGQLVGFDENGKAVAQAPPDTGVTTFNNRNGAVIPQSGDYSAEMVGAVPNEEKGAANGVAKLDGSGKLEQNEIPNIDCGVWDTNPVAEHNGTPVAHQNLLVDGNRTSESDTSETLEEHMANPNAHQNLTVDGNAGK